MSVEVGQIWRVTHPDWPERFLRVLALRAGIAYTTRCDSAGRRTPRISNHRIPVADLERGTARTLGATYSLLQTETI